MVPSIAVSHWLAPEALARLRSRLEDAVRAARRAGSPRLVSVTSACPAAADPSAIVAGARRPDDHWLCFEQPDRGGMALGALGCVRALEASGPDRFAAVSSAWRALGADALADPPEPAPGSGLLAVGGFAFAPDGGGSVRWRGFSPASLVVPELSLARSRGQTWLTVNIEVAPDDTVEDRLERITNRLATLRAAPLPMLDPAPVGRTQISSTPPSHYEQAVASAMRMIREARLQKIVLARDVEVQAPSPHDPAAVFSLLREAFPSCYVFAVGRGDATFLAASPELLVRREGARASTVALAGSTRRSADPAVDDHLGEALLCSAKDREENAIVARRIGRVLAPVSVWVAAAPEPIVVKVANIQHLACPIRAQLAAPLTAIELAARLHPTPAVGGEPRDAALELIPALEGLDRGWYAGPVGWTDSIGDGEFCVALRCALLRGEVAALYAGCGIVRDSDPAAELAETEVKLSALLPVLAS